MKTSLPDDTALYHAAAKLFQRSAGRSSVAAAAYRSASRLKDDRIGRTFDYTQKPVISSFIVAPNNSPAWIQDREKLWNQVEVAEHRKNAVLAREWEISIPRDIPESEWESFAREVSRPWVEAGAVVDIAIHCPPDVYQQPQPHIHAMLTLRRLDASTDSGFSKSKNDDLTRLFESGGRHGGGKRTDALKMERERIAGVMNGYLEKTASSRRVSHLSNSARGIQSQPEPTIGEGRKKASFKRGRGDRRTSNILDHRKARAFENELIRTEEQLMSVNLINQFSGKNSIKPRHQQDYKAKLLSRRFPDAASGIDAEKLHMVDTKDPKISRIQTRDGGWLEVEARQIRAYGPKGYADDIAQKLYDADYADNIERLEESIRVGKKGNHHSLIPNRLTDTWAETIADRWRSRGYTDVQESPDGVYIRVGQARLQDLGDEVRLHGKPSEPAIRAMIAKAADEWNGDIEVTGSKTFKDAVWIEGKRQGVKVYDESGDFYKPSAEIQQRWETDLAQMRGHQTEIDGIRQTKKLTSLMKNAAAGDKDSLSELQRRDPALTAFLAQHLDADQLKLLAQEKDADIEPQLDGMRELGRDILAEEGTQSQNQAVKFSASAEIKTAIEESLTMPEEEGYDDKPEPDEPMPRVPA
ncbi:MobA/MobL family protein [Endobacterium cereale]|uniref:MobA/MobL family protein n=1 Tax=Endobacterium cereale TaxID=2663029 RepID=UPI002B46FA5D|nr:MobA/MobL family protein [Endobacterium cereale]MEB2846808.1 MobA/MobL family protein [Endobacterium cereale]